MRPLMILAALLAPTLALVQPAGAWWRWIEAERPVVANFDARHAFAPADDAEHAKLSGGAWIGASGKRAGPLFAVYDVDVPAAGSYDLYARKFYKHGPYRVAFDGGAWQSVTDAVPLLDSTPIRKNVVANWTRAGTFALAAGPHRFRVESTSDDGAIAFDCFLLTDEPFTPRGKLRPDERQTSDRPGWFAWDPPADVADSPIDLSSLNAPIDGPGAQIVARDGQLFRRDGGPAVRFWGVNLMGDLIRQSDADLERHAAFLARRGVNLVRIHTPIFRASGPRAGAVDGDRVRDVQRAVAAFKRHGIYATLSIYFPLWIRLDDANNWAGYGDQNPFGLVYFDPKFAALYRSWWTAVLATPDPQTGRTLAGDPAILSLEMVNEDSLFFWTFKPYDTVPAAQMATLERRFHDWLAARYRTAQQAILRWPAKRVRGDDVAGGRIGISPMWNLVNERDARSIDTVRFLFEVQRDFYRETREFLRRDLGTTALVTTSNWTTASERYLTPIERATALVGDVVDRHGYFAGVHEGPKASSLVSSGDRYSDRSALRFDPEKPGDPPVVGTPFGGETFNDRPTMLSEVNWTEPNRFRAEMPWIAAAVGASQGLDAIDFFALGGGPGFEPLAGKFSLASPTAVGQFPAAALIYRLGLIDAAPTTVDVTLRLDDLLNLQGGATGVDAKARLAGALHVTIGDAPTSRPIVAAARFDDAAAKIVTSANGQLRWDYGRGLLTIDAPRAQAVVGFLDRAGAVRLGDVTIESAMPFGVVAVVPLDGGPIATSRRMLVQAMSEQQPTGWQTAGDSPVRTIVSVGTTPTLVCDLAATVTFHDATPRTMTPVDANGAAGEPMPIDATLKVPTTRPYAVLTPRDHTAR